MYSRNAMEPRVHSLRQFSRPGWVWRRTPLRPFTIETKDLLLLLRASELRYVDELPIKPLNTHTHTHTHTHAHAHTRTHTHTHLLERGGIWICQSQCFRILQTTDCMLAWTQDCSNDTRRALEPKTLVQVEAFFNSY